MLPLAFGRGIGAEMRNALGVASAGGILVSGVLTVVVLPILYDFGTRAKKKSPRTGSET
jgi:multidrug efflux pump subunit AcrB